MSDQGKIEKKSKERIPLNTDCLEKLTRWTEQLETTCKGLKVRHSDLVEWKVLSQADELTAKEMQEFKSRYWDDLSYASWIVREMKRARQSGESVRLEDYLQLLAPRRTSSPKKVRTEDETGSENSVATETSSHD